MADCESVLSIIEEDMKIYDIKNVKVGTVEFIHFSEASGASNSDVATPSDKPIPQAMRRAGTVLERRTPFSTSKPYKGARIRSLFSMVIGRSFGMRFYTLDYTEIQLRADGYNFSSFLRRTK